MRTRIKFCGITRIGRCAPRRRARRRCDRFRVYAREPALRRHHARRAAIARRAAAVRHARSALFMDDEPGWIEEVVSQRAARSSAIPRQRSATDSRRVSRGRYIKAVPMAIGAPTPRVTSREYPGGGRISARQPRARRARRQRRDVRLDARSAGRAGRAVHARRRPDPRQRGARHRDRATLRRGCLQRHRIRARHQGRGEDAALRARRARRGRCQRRLNDHR